MSLHRRFVCGLAGVCLGNALLAVGFAFGAVEGLGARVGLFGATLAVAGTGLLGYVAVDDPTPFNFEHSRVARHAPTLVLVAGSVSVLAGAVNLALAVGG